MSLIQNLLQFATPELMSKAAGLLGESESGVTGVVKAAIPTILGGLINKSSDAGAMGGLFNLITQTQTISHGGSSDLLGNLGSLLGESNARNPYLELGGKFLGGLFGNKTSEVSGLVASAAGVKPSSASAIIGMVAPMIMSYLGKKAKDDNMGVGSLISYLTSQKSEVMSMLPAGLSSIVGSVGAVTGASHVASSSPAASSESKGGMGWILPVLLGLLLLGGLWYFMKGCNTTKVEHTVDNTAERAKIVADSLAKLTANTATAAADTSKKVVTDAANSAWAHLGSFFKRKLSTGVELNIPDKGIENNLITFIEDKAKAVDKTTWFNFDRLLFETGKSTLKPESQEQIKNMAEILKAFPAVELKIGGYTDNVGKPESNLKLSTDRAANVVAELVKLGVDGKRLASEGYGEQHPVGDNKTEEGRAQNRRIAVRVTKK